MEAMSVPQRKVAARLHLVDGDELEGLFHVAVTGPDGAPGRLVDHLKTESELFLPFSLDDETVLIHKFRIVSIELGPFDREHEAPESEFGHRRRIEVQVTSVGLVAGWLSYLMPLDQGRLRDYLNSMSGFIPLYRGNDLLLINPRYVVSVREISEPAGS